jgi:hypothetical protein
VIQSPETVQCARLDVHELARDGRLKPGEWGLLFGQFEVTGATNAQALTLEFSCKSATGNCFEVRLFSEA